MEAAAAELKAEGCTAAVVPVNPSDGPAATWEELALAADSIVNALGRTPLQEEAAAFGLAAPVFYPIGDCLAAKNVYEANRLGFNVAMDIGK